MKELPMTVLFRECVKVLNQKRSPMHYRNLTARALNSLGEKASQDELNKNAENVREKLLQARQMGTFYTGSPGYAGALESWFPSPHFGQLSLSVDYVVIPGSAQAGVDAAFEALNRKPHIFVHNKAKSQTSLNYTLGKGFVLEKHVTQFFKRSYGSMYLEADNAGRWERWCDHDFKLCVNDRIFLVDVSGRNNNGEYGSRGSKHGTDIHLLCYINEDEVILEHVIRGAAYKASINPNSIFSPVAFLVWLNCAKTGFDYSAMSKEAYTPSARKLTGTHY